MVAFRTASERHSLNLFADLYLDYSGHKNQSLKTVIWYYHGKKEI